MATDNEIERVYIYICIRVYIYIRSDRGGHRLAVVTNNIYIYILRNLYKVFDPTMNLKAMLAILMLPDCEQVSATLRARMFATLTCTRSTKHAQRRSYHTSRTVYKGNQA